MKYTLLRLSVLLLFSCTKNEAETVENEGILGKWNLIETRISPGGIVDWAAVSEENKETIIFYGSGRYHSTKSNLQTSYIYNQEDSIITINKLGNQKFKMRIIKLEPNLLEVWGTACIEGCGYRYTR